VDLTLKAAVRARREEIVAELLAELQHRHVTARRGADGSIRVDGVDRAVRITPTPDGVELEVRGLEAIDDDNEAGWVGRAVLAPLVEALTTTALGDWLTDRCARRPSGEAARESYREATHHRPSFGAVLSALQLQRDDVLLEIGCGGGVFLEQALQTGCRAAGLDHSRDMIEVARELNAAAIGAGQLELVEGDAEQLPFPDDTFTCVAMMQVFFFLDAPRVLRECRRVLRDGGRLAVFTVSPDARGTPAAPEPMASRGRFYSDAELVQLALAAGFRIASVMHPDLERYARAADLPDDVLALFTERSELGQLLLARLGR
jgi:SAM-dependent methyltransferase